MHSTTSLRHAMQHTVCMVAATLIVTIGLTLASVTTDAPMPGGYSVTVTQLQ